MKPEQQRIKIAEACGATWQEVAWFGQARQVLSFRAYPLMAHDLGPMRWELTDGRILAPDIPNYLNDLNAMREAVETLRRMPGPEWFDFCERLINVCGSTGNAINAPAALQAETFLKTLNRWEEE